jgi:hypothetical protein
VLSDAVSIYKSSATTAPAAKKITGRSCTQALLRERRVEVRGYIMHCQANSSGWWIRGRGFTRCQVGYRSIQSIEDSAERIRPTNMQECIQRGGWH